MCSPKFFPFPGIKLPPRLRPRRVLPYMLAPSENVDFLLFGGLVGENYCCCIILNAYTNAVSDVVAGKGRDNNIDICVRRRHTGSTWKILSPELYGVLYTFSLTSNEKRYIGHVTLECLLHCKWWPRWNVPWWNVVSYCVWFCVFLRIGRIREQVDTIRVWIGSPRSPPYVTAREQEEDETWVLLYICMDNCRLRSATWN